MTDPQTNKPPSLPKRPPVKIKRPKLNLGKTQELITKLEEVLKTKVICYYTTHGYHIDQSHPDLFFDHLKEIGEQEVLSIVLISSGGASIASLRIASIIREYSKKLQVIVPSRCASAATVLALSANKIIMSPAGYLTAIDSTLTHRLNPKGPRNQPVGVSVDQVKRVLKFLDEEGPAKSENGVSEGSYRTLFKYLHPMALGKIDRYSVGSELIAKKMMKMHPESFDNEEKIEKIAEHLVNDYPLHGFPILYNEAKDIGLPVEKADKQLSNLLWEITKAYDVASKKTITHLDPNFYYTNGYPVFIESAGKRTVYRYSYNKRLNLTNKLWQTENNNSQWVNFVPNPEGKSPYKMVTVDTSISTPQPEGTLPSVDPLAQPTQPK